ncbi:hypothetical protein [Scytonema sp. PCC 10023]|uniref:hypothetical protein n=1 Tax=Scytonema sp. PCC 10023 TaxID=1680591 RepID=UPI0039C6B7F8
MNWESSGRIYRYHKLSLSQGLLEANIIERDGKITVLIGQGLAQRRGEFKSLPSAKSWATKEMNLALSQMQGELKPVRRKFPPLLYICLAIYILLGLVWLLFLDE